MSEKQGRFGRIIQILALIASWGMLIVAIMGWITTHNKAEGYEEQLKMLERRIDSLNDQIGEKNNRIKKQYAESLRRYSDNYRKIIRASSQAIDEYNDFVHNWGKKEFPKTFPEEKKKRFNKLKGKLDAIVDHVKRYRPLFNKFGNTLNGRVDYFHDQLIGDNEDEILRTFYTLKLSAESQIDALETQLDRIALRK